MALVRVCDRCGAPAGAAESVSVTVTAPLPATKKKQVAGDVGCVVTLGSDLDLCPTCRASALVAYLIGHLAGVVGDAAAIKKALGEFRDALKEAAV